MVTSHLPPHTPSRPEASGPHRRRPHGRGWTFLLAMASAILVATGEFASAQPAAVSSGGLTVTTRRAFLQGDDTMALWRQTVTRVAAGAPVTRLRSPVLTPTPSIEGLIETGWTSARSDRAAVTQRRSIIHFVPDTGGAWLDTATETAVGPPLPLPSVTEASPLLRPMATDIRQVQMMWTPDSVGGTPSTAGIELLPPVTPPASTELAPLGPTGVPTMPPAYPNTWAPFAVPSHPALSRAFRKVGSDYRNFYSCDSLVCVTAAFGAGALMANTGFDTTMQNAWQTGVAPTDLGTFFSDCKPMGEGRYALPIFGVAAATGLVFDGNVVGDVVGEWGSRSLRMFLVGAPPLYVLQLATGASRPSDGSGSQWHFFNDNNGVSGHAFIGAIPFLAAAEMVESPLLKGTLYVCSTFTGFSRMTDNAHYPSQVFLGWYLAWASSIAVSRTEIAFDGVKVRVVPLPIADLGGLAVEARW